MLQIIANVFIIPIILRLVGGGREMDKTIFDYAITAMAILVAGGVAMYYLLEPLGLFFYVVPFLVGCFWFYWYMKLSAGKAFTASILFTVANVIYSLAIAGMTG